MEKLIKKFVELNSNNAKLKTVDPFLYKNEVVNQLLYVLDD